MAARLIIDHRTGVLYEDFDARKTIALEDALKAERGLSPTVQIYLLDTDSTPATVALTNADLSLDIGNKEHSFKGQLAVNFDAASSEMFPILNATASTISYALNNIPSVQTMGGIEVEQYGATSYLLTAREVGAVSEAPSLTTESLLPHANSETIITSVGDSDTRAQWLVKIIPSPVASIAELAWSAVTDGSYSGLSATLNLATASLNSSIAAGTEDFELSINHDGERLHRSSIKISASLDPAGAGSLVIMSPSLFTLNGDLVEQGDTLTISGAGDMTEAVYDPGGVADDAFDMDNMVEGAATKILTATERAEIAANTAKTTCNTANVTSAGALMDSELGTGVQTALGIATGSTGGLPTIVAFPANSAASGSAGQMAISGNDLAVHNGTIWLFFTGAYRA